jgi:large subunit ribosomal protein L33
MAKGPRDLIALRCTKCKSNNYTTKKNKVNTPDKLELMKFCPKCGEHTPHKETSKLD